MGIIQQQTIKGTFYSYLGIFIGFITIYLIHPHVLTPEQIGLIGILTTFSQMFAQFSILGFNGTARYFPYFRDEQKNHNGYLFLLCIVALTGFILFAGLSVALKDFIINQKAQTSAIFKDYYWYLLPLTFFTLFFNILDIYSQRLYDTLSGRILNEFAKRSFILIATLFIAFRFLPFDSFMQVWLLANIIPTVLLAHRLYRKRQLVLKPNFQFIDKSLRNKLITMSLFAILTGSAPLLIQNIDYFMINQYLGLSAAGIYTIAFYLGTIIALPARSLYSIAYTIISESWKTNDFENIKTIYHKSCINQLIAALFIFIVIWANVDSIIALLPSEYAAGKYVIFFIGMANVIDSATGTNGVILATSKYFKYDSLFYFSLIGVAIGANLLFIPIYGITGAAIAFMVTLLIFNTFRYLFILIAFKMQPFTYKNLLIIIIGLAIYYISSFVPNLSLTSSIVLATLLDIGIRSLFITVLFLGIVYGFNLSEDINSTLRAYMNKFYSTNTVKHKKLP